MTRKYEKQRRAQKEQETRRRIVEAAVELHGSMGGVAATPTVIAERAGVGRVTYYRHFPDERSLLQACTRHFLTLNPPPELTAWAAITDPRDRLATALSDLYTYYGRTEAMLARAEQEAPSNPILAEMMAPFGDYLGAVGELLAQGRVDGSAPPPLLQAAIGHATAFSTWQSLTRKHHLDDSQAIALMVHLVDDSSQLAAA